MASFLALLDCKGHLQGAKKTVSATELQQRCAGLHLPHAHARGHCHISQQGQGPPAAKSEAD